MPRIRSIKPEIWHSHDFAKLSVLGKLVFLILITQADDEGRQYTDAHHIARAFLGDGRLTSGVKAALRQLEASSMITLYQLDDSSWVAQLQNFGAHQKISHPTPSRIPPKPKIPEDSGGFRRTPPRSDQIREDRILSSPPTPHAGQMPEMAIDVIDWWCLKRDWKQVPASIRDREHHVARSLAELGFESHDLVAVLEDIWQREGGKVASLGYFWRPAQDRFNELMKVRNVVQLPVVAN